MDKKTGKEILPFVTTGVCFDGIMLIDLCIIDTDNRLVVVRVAERGWVWWGVGEIGEDCESGSEVAQSCPTLCDPVDCSPPGYPVPGILQARTLEWAVTYMQCTS